jgi:hypothetical protein
MNFRKHEDLNMRKKLFFIAPLAILAMVLFTFLGGEIVMRLWNWLLPPLFGWRQIAFWQALGLLALCRILFGGFRLRGPGRSNFRNRMRDRCGRMSPEERERFRQGIREGWGFGPSASQSTEK